MYLISQTIPTSGTYICIVVIGCNFAPENESPRIKSYQLILQMNIATVKPVSVTTIKQQLVLCDLHFKFPFTVLFILIKPIFSDQLCNVTLFQCSFGRSHKTDLTVIPIFSVM